MADVLISYSRRDQAFVRELHASLTGAGRDVWVDWEDIPAASKWQQDIDDSIDGADSLVVVISPSSLDSEYCAIELKHAEARGKRIVPIAIEGADPEASPAALRELNWIWCREGDDRDAAFAALEKALDTDLDWSRAHTRLLVRAVEWDKRKDASLLLRGKDLAEVERVLAAHAGKEPRPTEVQQQYVQASRRGARRRQQTLLSSVTIALAVSIVLGVLALLQRNDARSATRKASSVALSAASIDRLKSRPDQALLLALDAYASSPSPDARNAGVTALEKARKLGIFEFVHGDSAVRDIAFSPRGQTLAVGSADGSVRIWEIRKRKQLATLAGSGSPIVSVDFARDGSLVEAGSEDGSVRLWNASSGDSAGPTMDAGRKILASAVSPNGRNAAAIGEDGRVWLWDVGGGKPSRLRGPPGQQAVLAFSPDGKTLAAGATYQQNLAYGSVQVWDVPSGKARGESPGDDAITALAFSPRDGMLVTGGYHDGGGERSYGKLSLWNPRHIGRGPIKTLETSAFLTTLAFGGHGRTLLAGANDGSVWRVQAAGRKSTWARARLGVPGNVTTLAVAPDGGTVAAAPEGATTVRVSDLDGPAPLGRVIVRKKDITGADVAYSPDGKTVAAADGTKGVVVASTSPGGSAEPHWIRAPARGADVDGVAFNPDGSITATDGVSSRSWNLRTHKRVGFRADPSQQAEAKLEAFGQRPGVKDVSIAAVAADGHTFAIGDNDGKVWLWDSRRKERAKALGGDAAAGQGLGSVDAIAFSLDGRTLGVAQTGSSPIQLWDVQGQRALGPPLSHSGDDSALAFSPDGRVLASSDGYAVRLWEGILWRDVDDLRTQVCRLVAGDLTRAEWTSIAPGIAYRKACG